MDKVPVVLPKEQTYVSKAVRDGSRRSMTGTSKADAHRKIEAGPAVAASDGNAVAPAAEGDGVEAPRADSAPKAKDLIKRVQKRGLKRQLTGTEEIWFPHDNDPALMKEFLWESGLEATRWVIHGTPSSSIGVSGLLELGASVLAICEDQHHKTNFLQCLRDKCVTLLLAGSPVFADVALSSRADSLLGRADERKTNEGKQSNKPKEKGKERKRPTKAKRARSKTLIPGKKRKKPQSPSSIVSSSSGSSRSSSAKKKAKKR